MEHEFQVISVPTCGCCCSHGLGSVVELICMCMCLCVCWRRCYMTERRDLGDKMCSSSLCNYLPIFPPSVAFIIPFRSHLRVGGCHSVAPPSLRVCRMKCRSPSIDLCHTAPASVSPYLFPRNKRHLEIRIIINQRSEQLFMQPLRKRQRMGVTFWHQLKIAW